MLRDNSDEKVSGAQVEVNTGRKWRADKAVSDAEARPKHNDIVETTTIGRIGLECVTKASWKAAALSERRKLVQQEVKVRRERRKGKQQQYQ